MAKTCVTEKTAQRQLWIENGLLELMQAKKLDEISVTELCCHLNLSRRSFYRYFQDLEDVLDSLMHHTFQQFSLPVSVSNLSEYEDSFLFWKEKANLLTALSRSGMSSKLVEYTLQYTASDSIGQYLIPDQLNMDIRREANLFVVSGFVALLIAWHQDGFQKTPAQMARITQRMLFAPLLQTE